MLFNWIKKKIKAASPSSEADGQQTSDWLFDTVIGFIKSPLWVTPIQTFIDENCITFDGEEENKLWYTEIHQNFCNLVERLLEVYLAELGISPEQFVAACHEGTNNELKALVTEYILAMDDFLTFKKMMEKRNIELQLEALISIQSLSLPGSVEAANQHECKSQGTGDSLLDNNEGLSDEELFELAVAASIRENDIIEQQRRMEEAELAHAIAMSLALGAQASEAEPEVQESPAEPQPEVPFLQEDKKETAPSVSTEARLQPIQRPKELAPLKEDLLRQRIRPLETKLTSTAATDSPATVEPSTEVMAAPKPQLQISVTNTNQEVQQSELERRQQYLKMQREKLINQKKKERDLALKKFVEQVPEVADTVAIVQDPKQQQQQKPTQQQLSSEEKKRMELRYALAKKFKEDLLVEEKSKKPQQQRQQPAQDDEQKKQRERELREKLELEKRKEASSRIIANMKSVQDNNGLDYTYSQHK